MADLIDRAKRLAADCETAERALAHTDTFPTGQGIFKECAELLRAIAALPAQGVRDNSFFNLIVDGMAEADRAMRKFPQPNYVISKVAEEAGEVVKAAIHCAENRETAENVRGEMRQLIAMLYRLWVEGDQVHGLAAIREGRKDG